MELKTTENAIAKSFRSYLIRVFSYMGGALLLTGAVAYLTSLNPTMIHMIYQTPLRWVVTFAPLVFVLVLSFGVNRLHSETAQVLFWLFAAVMGLSLSYIFLVYTGVSITRTFFVCAAMFLAMSVYGYITKSDLSRFGTYLIMALIGILIASLVNIWLKSTGLEFTISVLGVLIFTGLTAWDVQRIKLSYDIDDSRELLNKKAVMGALALYLDFLNLFLMLLRLMGNRTDNN